MAPRRKPWSFLRGCHCIFSRLENSDREKSVHTHLVSGKEKGARLGESLADPKEQEPA